MTRDEWIAACAQRLKERGGMADTEATYSAGQLALLEVGDVSTWDSPEDTADDEMSYWTDDEGDES